MAAAAVSVAAATVPAGGGGGGGWDEDGGKLGRAGSAVTVVVLDAGADKDSGDGGDHRKGDSSSSPGTGAGASSASGGPGDSGSSHGRRLLALPVTPQERSARSVGLDGVVLRGWHIRRLRHYAGLSVAELAQRLDYSRGAVWDWECERHRCPSAVYPALVAVIEAARGEREALMRRARLHLIVIDAETDEEGEG